MDFDKDRKIMLKAYFETEHQFMEIVRIIPLENKPETYSPRIYDILQSSCGQVENLLRLICDQLELEYEKKNFPSYYKTLNQTGILQRQQVDILTGHQLFQPFVIEEGNESPNWWMAYNRTKHSLPDGYKEGNLRNTTLALAGVYSLHCIASYLQYTKKEILNNELWMETDAIAMNTLKPIPEAEWHANDLRPKSQFFYPVSYYRALGGL